MCTYTYVYNIICMHVYRIVFVFDVSSCLSTWETSKGASHRVGGKLYAQLLYHWWELDL